VGWEYRYSHRTNFGGSGNTSVTRRRQKCSYRATVQVVFFCGDTKKAAREDIVNNKKNNTNLGARKIQIMVVDDHPVVLEGLRQLVNQEDDLLVCAKARNEKEALARLLPFLRLLRNRKTLVKKTDSCRFLLKNTLSK